MQKHPTGISMGVSVQTDKKHHNLNEDANEGFQSDDMHTEPLDRVKEVLEEIENKVLLKYIEDVDEANISPASTYKLKAGQNKEF